MGVTEPARGRFYTSSVLAMRGKTGEIVWHYGRADAGRSGTLLAHGEKLVTHNFGTGTRGFAAPEDCSVAVCLLPGTELAFENPVKYQTTLMFRTNTGHTVAIFRQINKGVLQINHDALEFPDGEIVLLTRLCEGQRATVLTLPTQPKTAGETEAQQRVAQVG